MGTSGRLQVCPVLTAMYGMGPDNFAGPDTELTSTGAGFSLAIGGELSRSETLAIVPSLQLGFRYERLNVRGLGGEALITRCVWTRNR